MNTIIETPSNPAQETHVSAPGSPALVAAIDPPRSFVTVLHLLFLALTVLFFALHFVHLSADFPNNSRWMDWSKYTDEGWYGDAAIRHFQLGHWYVPGDFNPAVALPVWPFLEAILFHFTGVSLIAVRALTVVVFGCILIATWLLIVRSARPGTRSLLAASVAVLFLATNPFCFVFTRIAILEPLLILLMLLALLAAQRAKSPPPRQHRSSTLWAETLRIASANVFPILALGVLLPLIILTKTTGLFLLPAVAWMLFAALGYGLKPFLQVGIPAAVLAATLWLAYFVLLVRPHYLLDYRYLFSANAYTKISRSNFFSVITNTVKDGKWFGPILFAAAIAATVVVFLNLRRLRLCPLIPALLLWAGGYAAFLAYHNNLQPRYYLVVAVPLTLLVPVVFRDLILPLLHTPTQSRIALVLASVVCALIVLPDARQTVSILRHPQYTFLSAARQVADYIAHDHRQHPAHSPLVLSISGSDISLMTGLHSICDDFGTSELADRVKQYSPGWYASWDLIEDDKMDALTPQFQVERVATFPAMDDPDRNLLVLYRLEPTNGPSDGHLRRRRNKLGQQPSRIQLKH